ncbi:Retrotransposable element Tf2 protein [Rhizoctonia solani]|uniref:Retrotransposable element Tf2 protein n=1 Tax=Rhizoctonia solani TaxID=456999 RepID=A0A8H8P897_9AGAM|nr:Retrotransposable element Tf2 protein [Rhizoctonia solani]QRW26400.1 Retrotransposable element Tf2 protein [Rhizoctonia solani]
MSASFSPAELNYDTHDKKLRAIVCAFEHQRIFLEGAEQPITVFTDHKNPEYWKSARTFNRRHACWNLMLASYNFSQKPDTLSRQPDHMDLEPSPQVMIPESHFEAFSAHMDSSLLDQIKEATQEDISLDTILLAVSDRKFLPHSVAQKFKDYTIQEGPLLYQGRIVVPDEPEIKEQLLSHFHDSPASGHQGRAQTLELISSHYCWPAMKFQVNCYVESCEICQRSKGHVHNYAFNLLSVLAGPWEDISYDFIVKFPMCKGYDSILVVVHSFSKMMHLIPCKETATAEGVAQMLLEHVWKLHGTPKRTVSDRGTTFNSKFLKYGILPLIGRLGSHTYCLALPETMKVHDVFHVSLLSAFKQDTEFDCSFTPPLSVITAEGEKEYEVDKFVDWAAEDRIWKYMVRWKGYAPHEDTWEPAKDLQHCKDKLRDFFANYPFGLAANKPIPTNVCTAQRRKVLKQPNKSKTAFFVTLQALTTKTCPAKLFLCSLLSQHAPLHVTTKKEMTAVRY